MELGEQTENAGGSEYKGRFREYDLRQAKVEPCKPFSEPVAVDAPMESSTTNKRDFKEHPWQQRSPSKPADSNLKSEGAVDFSSSYSLNFQGRTGERARPIRQDREREELKKFEGEPTYKAEFRHWDLERRERRPAEKWEPSSSKMADTTTNRADFREMKPSRRTLVRPVEEMQRSDDPFMGETCYNDSFMACPVEPRAPKKFETWNPPSVKFAHETTKQTDFQGAYLPKRESFRPDRTAIVSDLPFADSTTNRADFQKKPLGQRYVYRPEEYVKPEGDMEMTTTSLSQFREFPIDRSNRAIGKPSSSHILRGEGPMEQTSGYSSDFTGRLSPKRELMRPTATYHPSKDKFEGESTAKHDFTAKQLSPRESCRPVWEPVQSEDPFQSSTENRVSFVEQPLPKKHLREREVYIAPSVPFKASTTNKDSYQGEFIPKRGSCRPNQSSVVSDAKFEANTTFGDDFKKHDVTPRFRHQQDSYVPPEGVMEMLTSNQENFRDFGQVRRHVITKPGSSHVLKGEGRIADASSYKGDFSAPPPQARERVQPKREYKASDDPFNHVPTYKASFTGAFAPRQASFRPRPRPLQNLNAFEDSRDVSPYVPPVSV